MTRNWIPLALSALVAGCAGAQLPDVTRAIQPARIMPQDERPPGAEAGTCWGHEPGPEVTQIVSDTILAHPVKYDAEGKEISPAIYRKINRPQVINDGDGRWFQRVCDAQLTREDIATLQRALAVRGYYAGDAHGLLDPRTRRAIRGYQREQGLDSPLLSLSAAQQLGVIAVELEPAQS